MNNESNFLKKGNEGNEENEKNQNNENNENNENRKDTVPEEHKNKFKMKGFILGFLIMLLPYIAMFFYFILYDGINIIGAFFLAILFVLIGIVLWAITLYGFKKRSLAIGFLIGGFATLFLMFIFTGGCGLFLSPIKY